MFMKRYAKVSILLSFLLTGLGNCFAQSARNVFESTLDSLSKTMPALDQTLDFTVNEVPLSEFMRGIANEVGLNINLDTRLQQPITNNFSHVKVKDLLLFVHNNYDVDIRFLGNIMDVRLKEVPLPIPPELVSIEYDESTDLLSVEINDAPVQLVAKELTRASPHNVLATPNTGHTTVRSFIREMPFENALDKIAIGNNFSLRKTEDGVFLFEKQAMTTQGISRNDPDMLRSPVVKRRSSSPVNLKVYSAEAIDLKVEAGDLRSILVELFETIDVSYHFIGEVEGQVTVDVKAQSLTSLLNQIFVNQHCSYRYLNGVYWVGARAVMAMQDVRLVRLHYRTIDSLSYLIPSSLKEGIQILEYTGLNALILAGATVDLDRLEEFLRQLDQIVPVILIEVLIIDNKNSKSLATGISAGLSEKTVPTSGTILPGVDLSLSSQTINDIIGSLNGHGWINLGKVSSNFYVTLKALEENGVIDVRSTPQLSTMNGHAAFMSIGKTEYYKEELNVLYGSVTSSSQTTTSYKPVEAELRIDIRPIVSGSQDITMSVSVEQSDFTDRIEKDAPPGKVSRKFESQIRVKDQEMILLGGLEEASLRRSHAGVPFLSRIPIIKWFFSSSEKVKSKSKLNIFIKPTIIN